jgi:hypothetical protein
MVPNPSYTPARRLSRADLDADLQRVGRDARRGGIEGRQRLRVVDTRPVAQDDASTPVEEELARVRDTAL